MSSGSKSQHRQWLFDFHRAYIVEKLRAERAKSPKTDFTAAIIDFDDPVVLRTFAEVIDQVASPGTVERHRADMATKNCSPTVVLVMRTADWMPFLVVQYPRIAADLVRYKVVEYKVLVFADGGGSLIGFNACQV